MSTAIKRLDDGLTIRQMAASKSTRRRSDLKQTALATKECAMWVRLWTWLIISQPRLLTRFRDCDVNVPRIEIEMVYGVELGADEC
jgi:hypothetical protein